MLKIWLFTKAVSNYQKRPVDGTLRYSVSLEIVDFPPEQILV